MVNKISDKELLKLSDAEKCRTLIEIILGNVEYKKESKKCTNQTKVIKE
jgi:hypothetical protein